MDGTLIWLIISAVLAVIGGFVLFFTFLRPKNDTSFKGFLGWLYDFLTFKKLFLESTLRVLYLISTIFITLGSLSIIGKDFLAFILTLVVGNLALRITYEFLLMALIMCRNTSDISKNSSKIVDLLNGKKVIEKADAKEAKAIETK